VFVFYYYEKSSAVYNYYTDTYNHSWVEVKWMQQKSGFNLYACILRELPSLKILPTTFYGCFWGNLTNLCFSRWILILTYGSHLLLLLYLHSVTKCVMILCLWVLLLRKDLSTRFVNSCQQISSYFCFTKPGFKIQIIEPFWPYQVAVRQLGLTYVWLSFCWDALSVWLLIFVIWLLFLNICWDTVQVVGGFECNRWLFRPIIVIVGVKIWWLLIAIFSIILWIVLIDIPLVVIVPLHYQKFTACCCGYWFWYWFVIVKG